MSHWFIVDCGHSMFHFSFHVQCTIKRENRRMKRAWPHDHSTAADTRRPSPQPHRSITTTTYDMIDNGETALGDVRGVHIPTLPLMAFHSTMALSNEPES